MKRLLLEYDKWNSGRKERCGRKIFDYGSFIMNESKLFGQRIVSETTARIGDDSEETKNRLSIIGLFRDSKIFSEIGGIQNLKSKEQLDELFDRWFGDTISKMIKTTYFLDNKEGATKFLRSYVNNIQSLGDDARPFSVKNIEKELVDIVLNNGWLKEDKNVSNINIESPDERDVIYEDDEIVILRANSKAKCVMYGQGESWCISNRDTNFYNTYRVTHGATMYFVLQKNIKGDEHKIVILNYGDRGYALADRSNRGERTGGPNTIIPWVKIEVLIPNLKGKEEYFEYVPVTEEEKKYIGLITKMFSGDDLNTYIKDVTRDLELNNSPVTPSDFLRDYLSTSIRLKSVQIKSLDDELKETLIDIGYELYDDDFEVLEEKYKKKYIKNIIKNGSTITFYMYDYMTIEQKEDYLSKLEYELPDNESFTNILKTSPNVEETAEEMVRIMDLDTEIEMDNMEFVETFCEGGSDSDAGWVLNDETSDENLHIEDVSHEDISYILYKNEDFLNKLIEKAKKENPELKNVEIEDEDELIEYIKDTAMMDELIDTHRGISEQKFYSNRFKDLMSAIDDYKRENKYVIILINGGYTDISYDRDTIELFEWEISDYYDTKYTYKEFEEYYIEHYGL
jgi:hypothetical protein